MKSALRIPIAMPGARVAIMGTVVTAGLDTTWDTAGATTAGDTTAGTDTAPAPL